MNLDLKNHALNEVEVPQDTKSLHLTNEASFHLKRRGEILSKHPEILDLYEPDISVLYISIVMVVFMLVSSYYISKFHWLIYITFMYWVGGAITHDLMICFHASGHNQVFKSEFKNELLSIFCNFGQVIPSAIAFKRYHYDHHINLGENELDPDLPTQWEIDTFRTPFMKFLFLVLTVITYTIRPLLVNPKKPNTMEVTNIISVLVVDCLIYYYLGFWPLLYIFGSTVMGMSFHPFAFHFIARHFEFKPGVETYSYYGWFNILLLNMGYHVEHHDFPKIPPSKLPMVRKIAPEFYENVSWHDSYWRLIFEFIFNDNIGPWSRVVRPPVEQP